MDKDKVIPTDQIPQKKRKSKRMPKSISPPVESSKRKIMKKDSNGKIQCRKTVSKNENKEREIIEFNMYGKSCKVDNNGCSVMTESTNGKCFVCQGSKSQKLGKDHPILLCEGEG